MTKKYSQALLEASKKFAGTKYQPDIDKATMAYLSENYGVMEKTLAKLPTEPELLEALLEKLKGKSVHTNVKRILKKVSLGESILTEDVVVCFSSLLTHIALEAKESPEYKLLYPSVLKMVHDNIK